MNKYLCSILFGTLVAILYLPLLSGSTQGQIRPSGKGKDKDDGNGIYKKDVDTTNLPKKEKFKKGHPKAVKGEYLIVLNSEIRDVEVDGIFQEWAAKYGIRLIDEKYGIWKTGTLKGFGCYTDEKTAEEISKDPRVDSVSENLQLDPFLPPVEAKPPSKPLGLEAYAQQRGLTFPLVCR